MKKYTFILFVTMLFGLFSCSGPKITEVKNGVQFKTDSALVQIQFYKDNIVRVMKTPNSFEKNSLTVIVDELPNVDFKVKSSKKKCYS